MQAAVVAHPTLVDRVIVAGRLPMHHAFARPQHRVAARGAVRASEIIRRERADGTDVHDVEIVIRVRFHPGVARQRGMTAAIHKPEAILSRDFLHETDAPRTENAPLVIEHDLRADLRLFRLVNFLLDEAALAFAVVHTELLQATLARLVADRTIERMIDQQELHHAFTRLDDFCGTRVHDHALGHRRVAADGKFRAELDYRLAVGSQLRFLVRSHLRHTDIDEAHAAVADDGELRMIAIVRHFDAGQLRSLDQVHPFRGRGLFAINRQFDRLGHG